MGYVIKPLEEEYADYAFQINGALAVKNYTAQVNGSRIKITSTENDALSLLEAEVSEVEIDGVIYTNPIEAQSALNSIIYSDIPIVILTTEQRDRLILKALLNDPTKDWFLTASGGRIDPATLGKEDSGVDLSQPYEALEVTTENTQADMNAAVNLKIAQLINDKLSVPTNPGDFLVRVQINGEETAVSFVEDAPQNFQMTLGSSHMKASTVEFDLPTEMSANRVSMLFVRGLFIGKSSYSFENGKIIIDKNKVDYIIAQGDLIDLIYYL